MEIVLVSEGGKDILPEDDVAARGRVLTTRNMDDAGSRGGRELIFVHAAERLDVRSKL